MAITATVTYDMPKAQRISNDLHMITGSFTTSGTYATGGFDLTPALTTKLRSGDIKAVVIEENVTDPYLFVYDYTNDKVLGYAATGAGTTGAEAAHTHAVALDGGVSALGAPAVVLEEAIDVSSHTGTLQHLPAHIFSVYVTTGGTTGAFTCIPTGKTPVTTQCAVTFTSGVLTFLADDAVTRAVVSYIPKYALSTPSDLVVDEEVTPTANVGVLANNACAICTVWEDTATAGKQQLKIREKGIAADALASLQCSVDFTPASGNTSVTSNDTDCGATDPLLVTYLKAGAFPLVEEEAVSLTSEIGTMAWVGVPSTGQWLNATAGTTGPMAIGRARTSATGLGGSVSQLKYFEDTLSSTVGFDEGTPVTGCKISYVIISPHNRHIGVGPGSLVDTASASGSSHTHSISQEGGDEITNGATVTISTGVHFVAVGRA